MNEMEEIVVKTNIMERYMEMLEVLNEREADE